MAMTTQELHMFFLTKVLGEMNITPQQLMDMDENELAVMTATNLESAITCGAHAIGMCRVLLLRARDGVEETKEVLN